MTRTHASAANRRVSDTERPASCRLCRWASAVIHGFARRINPWARRDTQRLSRQAEAVAAIRYLNDQRRLLMVEKEVLCAERKTAHRQHKTVLGFDRRLMAINAELLEMTA